MDRLLQRLKEIPISLDTIQNYSPDDIGVIQYDNIKAKNLKELFKGKRGVIIFYEMHGGGPQIGHFSLLLNLKTPYYFSSYGFPAEKELDLTKSDPKKLLNLLPEYDYNKVRYQKIRHTNTCGLHCLARSYLHFRESKYKELMTHRVVLQDADMVVCLMCLLLVRNELEQDG